MAVSTGPWYGPTQIYFEYSYTVYGSYAQVTVNAFMRLASTHSSNGTYPVNWSGTWGSSNNSQYHNFSGAVRVVTWAGRVNLAYGSTTPVAFGVTATNYWGTASHTLSFSLPARAYSKPRPPKSPAASRSSDGQVNTSWATDYTGANGAQPWTGVYIDRWDVVSNTYKRVATVGWNTTSWSDRSTKADNRYRYRFASYNAAGSSAWVYTGYVATTPAVPTGVSAAKTGTNIVVKWKNNAKYQTGAIIYDNGTQVGTVGAGVDQFTHSNPSTTTTHVYTVRATVTGPTLQSGLSTPSNVVQLLAKPNPPTNLKTDKLYYGNLSDGFAALSWQHNPVDSSTQTDREVQYIYPNSNPAGTWVTAVGTQVQGAKTASTADMHFWAIDFEVPNGPYQFRVRTKGSHASWSDWSAPITVYLEQDPTVTINKPDQDEVVDRSRIRVEWAYSQQDDRAQAAISLKLLRGVTVVWEYENDYTENYFDIPYSLLDDTTYRIQLSATSSTGIVSNIDTTDFKVDYAEPAPAGVEATFDPAQGCNLVQITNDGFPIPAQFNRVYRNITQDSKYMALEAPMPPQSVTNLMPISDFEVVDGDESSTKVILYTNLLGTPTMGYDANTLAKWKVHNSQGSTMPPNLAKDGSYRFQLWDRGTWVPNSNFFTSPNINYKEDGSATGSTTTYQATAKVAFREPATGGNPNAKLRVKLVVMSYTRTGTLTKTVKSDQYILDNGTEATLVLKNIEVPSGQGFARIAFEIGTIDTGSRGLMTIFPGVALVEGWYLPGPFDGVNTWGDPDMQAQWTNPLAPYDSTSQIFGLTPYPAVLGPTVQVFGGRMIRTTQGASNGNGAARIIPTNPPGTTIEYWVRVVINGNSATKTKDLMNKPLRMMVDASILDQGKPYPSGKTVTLTLSREGLPNLSQAVTMPETYGQHHLVVDAVVTPDGVIVNPNEPNPPAVAMISYKAVAGDPDLIVDGLAYYEEHLADYAFTGDTRADSNDQFGYPVEFVWNGPPGASTSTMKVEWPDMVDEEWELVGEFPPNTEFFDYEGLTQGRTVYMVDAVSNIPSVSRVVAYAQADDDSVWIGSGAQFGETAALPYNIKVSETVEHPQTQTIHFDGMEQPTLISGPAISHKLSVAGKADPQFVRGMVWEDFLAMAQTTGVVVYRDKWSRRYYARLTEFSIEHISSRNTNITFGVEEVAKPNGTSPLTTP